MIAGDNARSTRLGCAANETDQEGLVRSYQSLFRLSAAMAITGLVCGPGLAPLAHAQDSQPPAAPAPAPAPADGSAPAADATAAPVDPPSRVGRVSALTGTVSFHTADQTDWTAASLNFPVTSGNYFWTEPKANAALGLGDVKLVLDQQTEADVDTLGDTSLEVTEPQGAIYLHVRDLPSGTTTTVTTPRGVVSVTAAGRYEIVAGDADQPTRLLVIDGAASIQVGDVAISVGPQQAASVTGSDAASFQGSVGIGANDPFIAAELAKELPPPPPVATTTATAAVATVAYTPPPLVQHMTGYESLQTVGQWQPSPQYGHVWYPPVQSNYVPYRDGHWAFVAPWGWTWVDNQPWGFAPFHYGRWAHIDNRWGWVPSEPGVQVDLAVARPVYAPALVSFVGIGAGVGVGIGVGIGAGLAIGASIGWVPLAPSEPYYPPFHASQAYVQNVNVTHVANVSNITNITNNTTTINNYANASAATVVPANTLTNSAPVAASVQHVTPQQLAAAKPVTGVPVQPTAATAGVTPTVARQLHLAPAPAAKPGTPAAAAAAAHKPTPGPKFEPTAAAKAAAAPAAAKPGEAKPGEAKPATPAAAAAKPETPAKAATGAEKPAAAPATEAKPATPAATEAKPATAAAAKPLPQLPKPTGAAAPKSHAAPAPAKPEATPAKPAAAAAKPAVEPAKPAAATAKPAAEPAKPAAAAAKPAAEPAKPAAEPAKPAAAAAKPAPAPKPIAKPVTPPKAEPKKCPAGEKTC